MGKEEVYGRGNQAGADQADDAADSGVTCVGSGGVDDGDDAIEDEDGRSKVEPWRWLVRGWGGGEEPCARLLRKALEILTVLPVERYFVRSDGQENMDTVA